MGDPVSMSGKVLRDFGRSPTCDFFQRSHLVHRFDLDDTVYFVMPRSLLVRDSDTEAYVEAGDDDLMLSRASAHALVTSHP